MKITVNVDCTPEEARTFLGLPDVQPMQEELLRELQDRMMANIRAMDPEELMKMWMPASIKGWEQFG
ncbi:MAG TPA: DUF6489 family protein, partial [Paracoccaceae bacterium]|nr:DUF6489 family protein [Paracoccaceae bacterium]